MNEFIVNVNFPKEIIVDSYYANKMAVVKMSNDKGVLIWRNFNPTSNGIRVMIRDSLGNCTYLGTTVGNAYGLDWERSNNWKKIYQEYLVEEEILEEDINDDKLRSFLKLWNKKFNSLELSPLIETCKVLGVKKLLKHNGCLGHSSNVSGILEIEIVHRKDYKESTIYIDVVEKPCPCCSRVQTGVTQQT